MSSRRMPPWWQIVGTLLGLALVLAWLGPRQLSQVGRLAVRLPLLWLLAALGMYFAGQCFNALRWYTVLQAQGLRLAPGRVLVLVMLGHTASQFLPSSIGGDGVRFLVAARWVQARAALALSLIVDRALNLLAMAGLLPWPVSMFMGGWTGWMGMGLLPGRPGRWAAWGKAHVRSLGDTLRRLPPKHLVLAWCWAWPSNLLPMAGTWLLARGLGMSVSYGQVIAVQTVSYWVTLLPVSLYGWGLREATYTVLFTALGVSAEQAVALAVWRRVVDWLLALPGAVLWPRWVLPRQER